MVSNNKNPTIVIILLLLSVLFSGCVEQKNIATAPDPTQNEAVDVSSLNLNHSSKDENIHEIRIVSFSSIYGHRNLKNTGQVLLSWENVPGNESHKLLSFLKNELGIDWIWKPDLKNHQNETANITKDEENKTIHVFTNENSIDITLFDESASMNSSKNGGYLWQVKEDNGNHNFLKNEGQTSYNISQAYFAIYIISIKNNGSTTLDFKLNDLRLHEGDRIFNATLEPYLPASLGILEVLRNLDKENKIHDTILHPGQSLNGTVVFRVR